MDDLISRQTLIDAFKEEFYTMYSDDYNYMIKFFNNLPSAEPELIRCKDCQWWLPPHGCNDTAGLIYTTANAFCSFAERRTDDDIKPNYCPNCGARMEESDED